MHDPGHTGLHGLYGRGGGSQTGPNHLPGEGEMNTGDWGTRECCVAVRWAEVRPHTGPQKLWAETQNLYRKRVARRVYTKPVIDTKDEGDFQAMLHFLSCCPFITDVLPKLKETIKQLKGTCFSWPP